MGPSPEKKAGGKGARRGSKQRGLLHRGHKSAKAGRGRTEPETEKQTKRDKRLKPLK